MKSKIGFCLQQVVLLVFGLSFNAFAATLQVGTGQTYTTIQAAINAAVATDIINVTAGSYPENVAINGKSNLTIQGVGTTTIVEPASGVGFALTSSNSITIKNLKIHTIGTSAHGIWVAGTPNSGAAMSSLTVQDNTIIVDGYSAAVYADQSNTAHSGWLIGGVGHGNTITINPGSGVTGDGMDLHDVTGSEVSYNTITLNNPTNSTNVLWTSELSSLSSLVFRNNVVSGSSGSEIAFTHNFVVPAPATAIAGVTISNNTFSNWGSRALRLDVTGAVINSNTFQMTVDTSEVIGGTAVDNTGTGNTFNVNIPAKIQKAINAAFAGDIIIVSNGTYTADLSIPAGKNNLELKSANGSALTTIKGVANVAQASFPLAVPNIDVLSSGVKIHGFTIAGPDYVALKYSSGMLIGASNVEIYDNIFKPTGAATTDEISQALQTYNKSAVPGVDISGLSIHNNTFSPLAASAWGYEGIYINRDAGAVSITISTNTFTGEILRAITTERSKTTISGNSITTGLVPTTDLSAPGSWEGIRVRDAGPSAGTLVQDQVTVSNNIITGSASGKGFGFGIDIGNTAQLGLTNIAITGNTIGNCVYGVRVRAFANGVTVSNNNLTGNTTKDVNNEDAVNTLGATRNWWGDTDPSNDFTGLVDYTPWLGATSGTSPMTYYTNDSIQDAINAAGSGDIIIANNGTYTGDLSIPAGKNNLELKSANGSALTIIKGVANVAQASFPLAVPNIDVLSSGVKIHGFTIAGPDYVALKYASGMVIGASNVEIYDNIFKPTGAATTDEISQALQTYNKSAVPGVDISGLNIHNNTFSPLATSAWGYEGIYINRDAGAVSITISTNTFTGEILRAITTERSKTTISGNSITTGLVPTTDLSAPGSWEGIRVRDAGPSAGTLVQDQVTVSNNTITGSASGKGFGFGIDIGNTAQLGLTNIGVFSNNLHQCVNGIRVRAFAGGVTANNNDLAGNTLGALNEDGVNTLNAENNWWGDNDPSNNVSVRVDYTPFIPGETVNAVVDPVTVPNPPPIVNTVAGVTVSVAGAVGSGTVGTSAYTGTPVTSQSLSVVTGKTAVKFVDVYVNGLTGGTATITVSYTDPQVSGLDENTLNLYMWYNNTWNIGTSPGRNTSSNQVWGTFNVTNLSGTPGSIGGNPPAPTAPIPTLNEWGLIILFLSIAVVAVISIRKRYAVRF